jgi:arylformamidase
MSLIDISQPLASSTSVWPDDQPVEWSWTAEIGDTSVVNVGAMRLSMHAGTHADAPLHVDPEGCAIDALPLEAFIGPAHVVPIADGPIRPAHVAEVEAPRVLFQTPYSQVAPTEWEPEAVCPVTPETVQACAEQGVVLLGTDGPSVDPVDSKGLDAHHALCRHGIAWLENLHLSDVDPGLYELVALPLRVEGGDAAPVRAVLRPDPASH